MCIQMDAELWKAHDPACERKPRVELAHSAETLMKPGSASGTGFIKI